MANFASDLIALLESPADLSVLRSRAAHQTTRWLAATPTAAAALAAEKITGVVEPWELVDRATVEKGCLEVTTKLAEVIGRLDAVAATVCPTGPGGVVVPVFAAARWELCRRIDLAVWRALVLSRLTEIYGHRRFMAVAGAGVAGGLWDAGPNATWSEALRSVARAAEVDWIPATARSPALSSFPKSWLGGLARSTEWTWTFKCSVERGWWGNVRHYLTAGSSPAILMLKGAYDWAPLLAEHVTQGRLVRFDEVDRYFPARTPPVAVDASSTVHLEVARIWQGYVATLPTPVRPSVAALEPFVQEFLDAAPAVTQSVWRRLQPALTGGRVRAVLNATTPDTRTRFLLACIREAGIPVVKWQHGAVWWNQRVTQRMDESDMSTADLLLTYGQGATQAYRSGGRYPHCQVRAVGSARLDALRTRSAGQETHRPPRRLLWVTTEYYSDGWYCGFSPPFADTLYYRSQVVLAEAFAALLTAMAGLELTIKLPPRYTDTDVPWCASLGAHSRCRVIAAGSSFADLALSHDAIVVDSPTTTLLESVGTRAAVFVLLGTIGWPPEAVALLARRAVCCHEAVELAEAVTRHMRGGDYPAAVDDDVFLRNFGTHQGDGASTSRAAALLDELLARRRPVD